MGFLPNLTENTIGTRVYFQIGEMPKSVGFGRFGDLKTDADTTIVQDAGREKHPAAAGCEETCRVSLGRPETTRWCYICHHVSLAEKSILSEFFLGQLSHLRADAHDMFSASMRSL